ncbi:MULTISPECIES: acyl-CoA dehydrogenase [Bosea]|uniref:acyl-CoA dehydrogenase n=1 Tax=Bosea TaxID=85413 RepID=UPI00215034D6|nr:MULTISPECIES: acyl-CoA dehydrogenase [Bosea]MCR4521426.1 acyl-CoA dehydrogenase [Bosea sp. 47.2.35]MDR6826852.1 alkylation response protein AidB-like acyl-CoA dehydrogenase [Bosea robiniae]MDR6893562.1 alkylation response protein AidB-like acyl-CoA dehydrogenase [Bosea sp. BE109]MDR7136739.1 alkylation response protein AidB-like acyl-CoA dehydrogenase [Bosea sp. BE168]MDR7173438.1 alkylation response protein AidB-like acyl-CoA dehydrogenase [Bosea sp. BE271]
MSYRAPVSDMLSTMRHVAGLDRLIADGLVPELDGGVAEAVLDEAAKFANDVIAPLNRVGDLTGSKLKDGAVTTPPGWKEAYKAWAEAGWNALPAPEAYGGQGLPALLQSACIEMWNSAAFAFALGPLLTVGAIEALHAHGSDHLKETYLAKLVSGEWMGTMNLTEPQAGSDLNALRSKAERVGDGTYRITGQKIFITYGEHDLTENIIHLVLARLPDAPPGTRGISLFLVPKFLVNADGSLGAHNDLRCSGIEHKLGIHASPTCSMAFGDNDGAIGWLIGEENRGLACMFTMMNNARLNVALQGVAIAERAYQQALAFAHERKQGAALDAPKGAPMSPIIVHPDVRRMLMDMRAKTQGARAISYQVAEALDRSHRETDEGKRKAASERAAILTPIAKAYATDIGIDVASTGVQVHGGMGFVEETGAAQHLRDARIAAIYEGTNGIQAIDLVTRKLPLSQGDAVQALIAEMRGIVGEVERANNPGFGHAAARLGAAVDSLEKATEWMLGALGGKPADALAGATPYLKLFALAQGGTGLAKKALATRSGAEGAADLATARFYAECIATEAPALELAVTEGAGAIADAAAVFAA